MKTSATGAGNTPWVLCDDDTRQHALMLSETEFRLVQMDLRDPEKRTYMVCSDVITLDGWLDKDGEAGGGLAAILKSYGYAGTRQVRAEYGDMANQVMCECIFESLIPELGAQPLYTGTEQECERYIAEYISRARQLQ